MIRERKRYMIHNKILYIEEEKIKVKKEKQSERVRKEKNV